MKRYRGLFISDRSGDSFGCRWTVYTSKRERGVSQPDRHVETFAAAHRGGYETGDGKRHATWRAAVDHIVERHGLATPHGPHDGGIVRRAPRVEYTPAQAEFFGVAK